MIRPLDMQVSIVKTHEVGNTSQNQHQKASNEQLQFSAEMEKHTVKERENVVQSEKADKKDVDADGKGSKDRQRKRKKNEKPESKGKDSGSSSSTSMFDVKI